jgi:hypothetical protein
MHQSGRDSRAVDTIATPAESVHAVDGRERIGADGVYANEKLLNGTEDDGRFTAPAVR